MAGLSTVPSFSVAVAVSEMPVLRERDVLAHNAEGRSDSVIARELVVTQRTIASHVAGIFEKLNLPLDDDHRRVLAVRARLPQTPP